jgi:glycosyltransferase involved in cell wall biosynthesis
MKKKILFILHYPPPAHGAAVVGSYIMESGPINSEFECRYINLGTSQKIDEIGKKSFNKLTQVFRLANRVRKEIMEFKPDLCYVTPSSRGPGLIKDILIISVLKALSQRKIYHFHNKGVSTSKAGFFRNMFYRFIFRNAYVILLSKLLYSDIRKYVPETMVRYCPNGIPEIDLKRSLYDPKSDTKKSGGPAGIPEILFLSNFIITKGILVALDAFKILKDRGISFHCRLAGENGDLTRNDIENNISKLGLGEFITVTGGCFGEHKMQVFAGTDIFIHPTFNDCLPLVLLEAMQFSIPVISTPEGGIPDIVEDGLNGFLVPQKSAVALADKLELLIKDPELRLRMGEAGRSRFGQLFTLERFEERMKQILLEVVNIEK